MADFRIQLDPAVIAALVEDEDGPVAADLLRRGLAVERAAKRNAPVDTGRLRSSIDTNLGTDDNGVYVEVGSDVEYALHQETGTRFQPGQPYLRPALKAAE